MASKDLYNNIKVVRAISPGVYLTGTNPAGQAVDCKGYESVVLIYVAGSVTDAQTLILKHSFDNSTYADVEAKDVISDPDNAGSAILADFKAPGTTDHKIVALGYRGPRRFLKVESTGAGATGAAYGVVAVLGHGQYRPTDRS